MADDHTDLNALAELLHFERAWQLTFALARFDTAMGLALGDDYHQARLGDVHHLGRQLCEDGRVH